MRVYFSRMQQEEAGAREGEVPWHERARATLHAQFATDVIHVLLDGPNAQDKTAGDLAVGRAIGQQLQDLVFALGQRFHQRTGSGSKHRNTPRSWFAHRFQELRAVSWSQTMPLSLAEQGHHR